jgi:TatD DNase family protein
VPVEKINLTDTHCHLDFAIYEQDRELVIERARDAGLVRMLNPGIDFETSRTALLLAEHYPEVYAAVGIHPNSALSWDSETYRALEELAHNPKVVAIGEIGLDYYRMGAPVELQRSVFRAQLELAGSLGLPVIIHSRDAGAEMIEILANWAGELSESNSRLSDRPGALHSYSGDRAAAEWAVGNHFYIGVTGPVTYRNADQLRQVVVNIPLDNILIETDAPFLSPHPYRGERNEPAHVALIAGKIAELRTIEIKEAAEATTRNAARLFCWRETD